MVNLHKNINQLIRAVKTCLLDLSNHLHVFGVSVSEAAGKLHLRIHLLTSFVMQVNLKQNMHHTVLESPAHISVDSVSLN